MIQDLGDSSNPMLLSFELAPIRVLPREIFPLIFSLLDPLDYQRLSVSCKLWSLISIETATKIEIQKIQTFILGLKTTCGNIELDGSSDENCNFVIASIAKGCLSKLTLYHFKHSAIALKLLLRSIFLEKKPDISHLTHPLFFENFTSIEPIRLNKFLKDQHKTEFLKCRNSRYNAFCFISSHLSSVGAFVLAEQMIDKIEDKELKDMMLVFTIEEMIEKKLFKSAYPLVNKISDIYARRFKVITTIQTAESKANGEFQELFTLDPFN